MARRKCEGYKGGNGSHGSLVRFVMILLLASPAIGGDLNPPAPPDDPASAPYTLWAAIL